MLKAWIISIGNELLIGRIVNTNASWLAKKLVFLGFTVNRIITVPDEKHEIVEEIKRAFSKTDVIITTGGLGPTYDDMTSEAVAEALNRKLVLNETAYELVRKFYESRGLKLTKERIKMAYVPEGSIILSNPVGAAPAYILDTNNKAIIVLPGVPSEMKAIFEEHVEAFLKKKYPITGSIVEYYIVIENIPESSIAPIINELSRKNKEVYIKSHPKGHETKNPILDIRVFVHMEDERKAVEKSEEIISVIEENAKNLGGNVVEKGRSI